MRLRALRRRHSVAAARLGWARPSYLLCWATACRTSLLSPYTAKGRSEAGATLGRELTSRATDMISMFFERLPCHLLPVGNFGLGLVCTILRSARYLPALLLAWGNLSIDSDSLPGLPFLPAKSRLLQGKFTSPQDVADNPKACRTWCVKTGPKDDTTSHWWMSDLDEPTLGRHFERLATGKCVDDLFRTKFSKAGYALEPVRGMNLRPAVSCLVPPRRIGQEFRRRLLHGARRCGPYCFFPFASVFRCIVAHGRERPRLRDPIFRTPTRTARPSRAISCGSTSIGSRISSRRSLGGAWHPDNVQALKDDPTQKWRMVLKLHYAAAPLRAVVVLRQAPALVIYQVQRGVPRVCSSPRSRPQSKFEKFVADLGVERHRRGLQRRRDVRGASATSASTPALAQ